MTPEQLKDKIIAVLEEKKVEDLAVLDIAEKTEIADYMILMTCRNNTHVRTICDYIEEKLEESDICVLRRDGAREGKWVVLDYGSVIVHVFTPAMREHFSLEKFWNEKDASLK